MCGIVGYIGEDNALNILRDGLRCLEYRGYDSSGIAILGNSGIEVEKAIGKIKNLELKINNKSIQGYLGIGHTRWATHGKPSLKNAHPHGDCSGKIWVVHNGIIENYNILKKQLQKKGHIFKSETDTEVIPHLIEDLYNNSLAETLQEVLKIINGAYSLVAFHRDEPDKLLVARYGSSLVIGIGKNEMMVASDISAMVRHTNKMIYLDDGEMAEIKGGSFKIYDFNNNEIDKKIQQLEWDIGCVDKTGYQHFMLKEIFEQPDAVMNSLRGRCILKNGKVKLGGLETVIEKLRKINKISIVACGTARNAGLIGEYMIEEYAGISVEVDYASEFRYRKSVLDKEKVVLAISQSGETADTLAAIREAKEKGLMSLGIVNVVGSTIARETEAGVYNHIGPEIAVASTKAFTSQLVILSLLSILFGRQRQMSLAVGQRIIKELQNLPKKMKIVLGQEGLIKNIAKKYYGYENFAYLGRKYNSAVASEGALKLKEISYIHAESFPSGEMKHGSIALIDKKFPSFFIVPVDSVYEKNLSNMAEIKSRGGKIIAITTRGNKEVKKVADDVIYIPKTLEMLTPILSVIPLQLFAYYTAVLRGLDVDKPRNLAKSVTVE